MATNEFAYADVSQRGPILIATEQGHAPQHTVHFYIQDQALVESLSKFVGTALGGGGAAIVLATTAHRDALLAQLKSRGLDPSKAIHENRFILRDACDMLSQIMVNGLPDTARFTELVSGLIMRAKNAAGGEDSELAIFGELVAVLWADGNAHAAIRLEQLWNEAAKSHHFSLRCGYPITGFYRQEHSDAFLKICAEHSAVIPSEPYTDLKTEARRLENIAHLQQKARALESEKSLRRLSLHLLRTQDEERRRIGRELHDSLGQYLSVLKMKLDSVNRSGDKTSVDLIRQDVAECAKLAEEAIKEVRTISYLLYPPMLEEMGLKSAVPWYLDGFCKRSGIKTTFQIPSDFPRLSPEIELAMFRVLQESLTNVHRHSGSPSADVRLLLQNGVAVLAVTDKGKGFPEAILEENKQDWMGTPGVGLRGMTERLRQLGGTLELSSTSEGTTVRASVPMDAAAAPADSQFNLGLESSNTLNSK